MANTFNLGNGNWAQKTEKLLAYNAENNNYKPLPFDFDRGSTATRVNRDGLIETVATDEPRIDFLNNTKGHLLLEPSRQNRITYSEDFSQWSTSRIDTPYVASITDPSGSLGAYTLEMSLGETNGGGVYYSGISITGFNCFSVFAKKNTADYLVLADTGTTSNAVYFNLSNGTVGTEYNATGEIENFGNGWYRCTMKYNLTSSGLKFIYISNIDGQTSNSVQGGDSIYIWGAQMEEGSYATSYIPTQGETNGVTRLVDACYNNNLGNVIGQTEGTFYIETIPLGSTTSFTERIMQFEASGSDFITFQRYANSNLTFYGTDGSNSWTIQGLNLFVGGETIKIAGAYKDNDIVLYVNGVQIGTNNTANAPQVDRMWFANNASGSLAYSGSHKEVKFYNTRLSNSELATLTTL